MSNAPNSNLYAGLTQPWAPDDRWPPEQGEATPESFWAQATAVNVGGASISNQGTP